MSNSPLAVYRKWSPNYESRQGNKITHIVIHHMAGNLTIETCGNVFSSPSKGASSHYGVGTDGRIGQYVDEAYRAWTTSNFGIDSKAVTIEVANSSTGGNWPVSDKALESTINLCVDICKRNGIKKLNYTGDKTGNLHMHRWYAATGCPGEYLGSKFSYIANQVNARLNPTIGTPVISTVKNVNAGSQITWKSATNAKSYTVVYKPAEESSWKTAKSGLTSTSYTMPKAALASGVKYTYAIRAVNGSLEAESKSVDLTYIEAPVIDSLKNLNAGTQITWNSIAGAKTYIVMYKPDGGSWDTVKEGITDTYYTIPKSKLKSGTTYWYTVKAKGAATSGYTSGKGYTYIAAPEVKSTKNLNAGTQVTWSTVKGAKTYTVMGKHDGGTWQTLTSDLEDTSYLVQKSILTSGVKYWYTVKAVGNTTSGYTSGKAQTYVAAPKVSSVKKTSSGVKVTWEKVDKAKSYIVMIKVKGGDWKEYKADITSNTYTIPLTAFTSGKTYYFTVKAQGAAKSGYTSGKSLTI